MPDKKFEEAMTKRFDDLEKLINSNHKEMLNRIKTVEKKANEALSLAKNNEVVIADIVSEMTELKSRVQELETKEEKSKEVESRLKEQLSNQENYHKTELEKQERVIDDVQNRSMRDVLVIQGLKQVHGRNENNWNNCCKTLTEFLSEKLSLDSNYVDRQISRAHRGGQETEGKIRPMFVKFICWRFADFVRTQLIGLHKNKKSTVTVQQKYTKQLTTRRNKALEHRKKALGESPDQIIHLEYPAKLFYKHKNTEEPYRLLREF